MNPKTNQFEALSEVFKGMPEKQQSVFQEAMDRPQSEFAYEPVKLLRPNGEPVPKHWTVLAVGQKVVVENYTFEVAHIGEKHLLLEPVGPVLLGKEKESE